MDFGKLKNIENVDFTLPPDPEGTTALLKSLEKPKEPRVYFASPVWSHKGFLGKIYPASAKPADYLHHYAKHYNSIELNTTFYGVNPKQIDKWEAATPEGFMFCPKLTGEISHKKQLRLCQTEVQTFCEQMSKLGTKLGPAWLLLPQDFAPHNLDILENFLAEFPKELELGVELRHPDWFQSKSINKEVFEVFERHNTHAIITDVSGRRDVLHMRITSPTSIIRWVGNRLHPTDFTRLDAWAERIASWLDQGLHTVYIFMHQPEEDLTVENAIHFVEKINKLTGLSLQPPQILEKPPVQGSLF